MTGLVDRGAIFAAMVGIGMALVIAISFLLVIPIELVYLLLGLPAGLLIGYYANARSATESGPSRLTWPRVLANGLAAGLVTALSLAVLLLAVKALFFFADTGYRAGDTALTCEAGAACVYERYLADGYGEDLEAEGVTDVETFTSFYWQQQLANAGILLGLGLGGSLIGAGLFGLARPKAPDASHEPSGA